MAELVRVCEEMRQVPVFADRYWELKARRNELWAGCPLDWLQATGTTAAPTTRFSATVSPPTGRGGGG